MHPTFPTNQPCDKAASPKVNTFIAQTRVTNTKKKKKKQHLVRFYFFSIVFTPSYVRGARLRTYTQRIFALFNLTPSFYLRQKKKNEQSRKGSQKNSVCPPIAPQKKANIFIPKNIFTFVLTSQLCS